MQKLALLLFVCLFTICRKEELIEFTTTISNYRTKKKKKKNKIKGHNKIVTVKEQREPL
ncbi:hypothetical protein GLYMA_13G102651v4 [Glycine max]|nr:hypothetical protein GLYMA_13G102651v4 [Glycine max]KAH1100739.1 hypothetical protein GYH30_035740 [Glycine max]